MRIKTLWITIGYLGLLTLAHAQNTIDGDYYWETTPGEKYQKYVDLNVKTAGSTITIAIDLVWTPGAHVEMGASAPTAQLVTQTAPGGTTTYIFPFAFEDGFKNKGTGKLTISGNQCTLSLTQQKSLIRAQLASIATTRCSVSRKEELRCRQTTRIPAVRLVPLRHGGTQISGRRSE